MTSRPLAPLQSNCECHEGRKSGPQLGPQLQRHLAAAEGRWRPRSNLEQADLNSAALAWQARGVRGSNPRCSTLDSEPKIGTLCHHPQRLRPYFAKLDPMQNE